MQAFITWRDGCTQGNGTLTSVPWRGSVPLTHLHHHRLRQRNEGVLQGLNLGAGGRGTDKGHPVEPSMNRKQLVGARSTAQQPGSVCVLQGLHAGGVRTQARGGIEAHAFKKECGKSSCDGLFTAVQGYGRHAV